MDVDFYDIGANCGYFSLIASYLGARVFAFEPVYSNYQKLVVGSMVNNLRLDSPDVYCYERTYDLLGGGKTSGELLLAADVGGAEKGASSGDAAAESSSYGPDFSTANVSF